MSVQSKQEKRKMIIKYDNTSAVGTDASKLHILPSPSIPAQLWLWCCNIWPEVCLGSAHICILPFTVRTGAPSQHQTCVVGVIYMGATE